MCLGTLNSTYQTDIISIQERYFNLPFGVFNQFTQKLCFPVLFGLIGINVFIIKKYHHETDGKKIISSLKWIALFSLLYIILLPLGGYRPYRQNILRFDTVMPITICIIYLSACSSYFLWNKLTKNKTLYKGFILTILLIFTNSDRLNLKDNACEIAAFETISTATTSIVPIHSQCKILSWKPINNYQESELNAELLKLWRISNQKKLYFCP